MRRFAIGAVVLSAAFMAAGLMMVERMEWALRQSRNETAQEAKIEFDLATVNRADTGFSPLGAPSAYTSGVVFQGHTVLAGGEGLTIGMPSGRGPRQLRIGVDLPAAPIAGLAVGVVRGGSRPSLVVATRGEGVLFLDEVNGVGVRQLRPREAALRDATAVAVMASGELLIGTRTKGLLRYDGKTLGYFSPSLTGVPITALAADGADFWAGTRDRGVFHWHAGQVDRFGTESGMPDEQVESIALKDGKTFVGTPLGVEEFEDGKPQRVLAKGVFSHALALDGERLLVGSIDEGVLAVPLPEQGGVHRQIPGESDGGARAESFLSADDGLFAVTAGGLMRRESGGGWTPVGPESVSVARGVPVLADRNVSALSFAPDGKLWVGYFDHGLDAVNLATGEVRHTEDDHVFCVNRIVQDAARSTMDVATANGLVFFDAAGRERQVLLRRDGLIADQVTDIAFTKNGTVLATPAGITFLDAGGVSSLYGFQGLVNNHVYALASDAAGGRLMAGTLGGTSVLDDTAVLREAAVRRNLTTKNSGLKQNWITAIVAVPGTDEKRGQRWFVGTYGGGVVELGADGQFAAMEGATRAMEINPNAMLVTARHVFAGSLGDGLFVYDRASQRWSQVKAGLPSLNVTAMAEREGELYVGTENGVVHIAEARLAP
jgi:ligand-binding sensor domain-containing protein